MYKCLKLAVFSFFLVFSTSQAGFAQDNLHKLFIKAAMTEVDGTQIPDTELEESAKDMRKKAGKFVLVEKESEADFLIVVNERISTPMAGSPAAKSILATLYVRKEGKWSPATKLRSGTRDTFWGMAADKVVKNAAKWIRENPSEHPSED